MAASTGSSLAVLRELSVTAVTRDDVDRYMAWFGSEGRDLAVIAKRDVLGSSEPNMLRNGGALALNLAKQHRADLQQAIKRERRCVEDSAEYLAALIEFGLQVVVDSGKAPVGLEADLRGAIKILGGGPSMPEATTDEQHAAPPRSGTSAADVYATALEQAAANGSASTRPETSRPAQPPAQNRRRYSAGWEKAAWTTRPGARRHRRVPIPNQYDD